MLVIYLQSMLLVRISGFESRKEGTRPNCGINKIFLGNSGTCYQVRLRVSWSRILAHRSNGPNTLALTKGNDKWLLRYPDSVLYFDIFHRPWTWKYTYAAVGPAELQQSHLLDITHRITGSRRLLNCEPNTYCWAAKQVKFKGNNSTTLTAWNEKHTCKQRTGKYRACAVDASPSKLMQIFCWCMHVAYLNKQGQPCGPPTCSLPIGRSISTSKTLWHMESELEVALYPTRKCEISFKRQSLSTLAPCSRINNS